MHLATPSTLVAITIRLPSSPYALARVLRILLDGLYCVSPNSGWVEPGQSVEVQGQLCASSKRAVCQGHSIPTALSAKATP